MSVGDRETVTKLFNNLKLTALMQIQTVSVSICYVDWFVCIGLQHSVIPQHLICWKSSAAEVRYVQPCSV